MSFWQLSDGGSATETGAAYEIEGGSITPIPDDTSLLAMIDEANWKTTQGGDEYINLRWTVVTPDEYKNRKIFQKLWVTDDDPNAKDAGKKRDKARRMLAAIDANAGGKLSQKAGKPSDDDLARALTQKLMTIKVKSWSMDDNQNPGAKIEGNWICAVSAKSKVASPVKAETPKPAPVQDFDDSLEGDDIPF